MTIRERIGRALGSHVLRVKAAMRHIWSAARFVLVLPFMLALVWGLGWFLATGWSEVGGDNIVVIQLVVVVLGGLGWMLLDGLVLVVRHLWAGQPLSGESDNDEPPAVRAVRETVWLCLILGCGLALFSFAGFFLEDVDAARIGSSDREPADYVAISELFLWHALDVVPLADVPETLKWDEPAPARDTAAGFLILGFKLVVIAPLVAALVALLAPRRAAAAVAGSQSR